jgi:hypothetical protein
MVPACATLNPAQAIEVLARLWHEIAKGQVPSSKIGITVAFEFQNERFLESFDVECSLDDPGQAIVDFTPHNVVSDSPSHDLLLVRLVYVASDPCGPPTGLTGQIRDSLLELPDTERPRI